MQVIDQNNLNTPRPFSISYRQQDGDIYVYNGDKRLSVKDIFNEMRSRYTSRFRGAIVYSERTLRENIKETQRIMAKYFGEKYNLVWAMKSAPVKRIVEIAAEEGAAFDVGSYEEMSLALKYTKGNNVYHTSPGKFDWDVKAIVENKCISITDNLAELKELNALALSRKEIADVGIRINPSVDSNTQAEVSTGSIDSKFGVPEISRQYFEEIEGMKNVRIRILHMHIGTQISSIDDYLLALKSMIAVYNVFIGRGFKIDTIDIGGGFPFSYQEEVVTDDAGDTGHVFTNHIQHSFEDYIAAIASAMKSALGTSNLPTISIEPGRHIAAGTAFAVGYILNTKMYPNGIQWLMSSISVNDLYFKQIVPSTFFDVHVLTQGANSETVPTAIGGTLCFSGDVLTPSGKALLLQNDIARNDIVMYGNIGAYSLLGSGNFHNMPRLPIVMIGLNSELVEIREQEKPYFEQTNI
jgi:diaminopimelate decarboxylase